MQLEADWDEAEHPRDPQGKFTDAGGASGAGAGWERFTIKATPSDTVDDLAKRASPEGLALLVAIGTTFNQDPTRVRAAIEAAAKAGGITDKQIAAAAKYIFTPIEAARERGIDLAESYKALGAQLAQQFPLGPASEREARYLPSPIGLEWKRLTADAKQKADENTAAMYLKMGPEMRARASLAADFSDPYTHDKRLVDALAPWRIPGFTAEGVELAIGRLEDEAGDQANAMYDAGLVDRAHALAELFPLGPPPGMPDGGFAPMEWSTWGEVTAPAVREKIRTTLPAVSEWYGPMEGVREWDHATALTEAQRRLPEIDLDALKPGRRQFESWYASREGDLAATLKRAADEWAKEGVAVPPNPPEPAKYDTDAPALKDLSPRVVLLWKEAIQFADTKRKEAELAKAIRDATNAKPWPLIEPAFKPAEHLAVRAMSAMKGNPTLKAAAYKFTHGWEESRELKEAVQYYESDMPYWSGASPSMKSKAEAIQAAAAAEYTLGLQSPDIAVPLWRGVNNRTMDDLAKVAKADSIVLETVASFTTVEEVARGYTQNENNDERVVEEYAIQLHLIAGGGFAVWPESKYSSEREVVLPRGARLDVVGRKFDGQTLHLAVKAGPIVDVPPDALHMAPWGLEQLLFADWDEDAHPRDDRGRFASGPGGGGLRQPSSHAGADLPGGRPMDADERRQAEYPPAGDRVPTGPMDDYRRRTFQRPWGVPAIPGRYPSLEERMARWQARPMAERLGDPRRREFPPEGPPSYEGAVMPPHPGRAADALRARQDEDRRSGQRSMAILEERARRQRFADALDRTEEYVASRSDRAQAIISEWMRMNEGAAWSPHLEEYRRGFAERFPIMGRDLDTPQWRAAIRENLHRANPFRSAVNAGLGPRFSPAYPNIVIDERARRIVQEETDRRRVAARNDAIDRSIYGNTSRLDPRDLGPLSAGPGEPPATAEEIADVASRIDMTERARVFANNHRDLVDRAASMGAAARNMVALRNPEWTRAEVNAIVVAAENRRAEREAEARRAEERARLEAEITERRRAAEARRAEDRAAASARGEHVTSASGADLPPIAQAWGTKRFPAEVSYTRATDNGTFYDMRVTDESGLPLTEKYQRSVTDDGTVVEHDYFKLHERARDKGVAEDLFRQAFDVYKQEGVETVKVTAGLDGGPYVWADYGFDWDEETNETMRQTFGEWLRTHSEMTPEEIGEAVSEIRHSWHLADFGRSGKYGYPKNMRTEKLRSMHLGKAFLLASKPQWEGEVDLFSPSSPSRKRMEWRLYGDGRKYRDDGVKLSDDAQVMLFVPQREPDPDRIADEEEAASYLPPEWPRAQVSDDWDDILETEDVGL